MGDSDTTVRDEELLRKKRALLFQQLKREREQAAPEAVAITRRSRASDRFPLSFAQQRLWFLDQLQPGSPVYNLPRAVHFTGPLDVAALAWSLRAIMQRHEILRTTFAMVDEQPVQVIGACAAAPLQLFDLRALPEAMRAEAAARLSNASIQLPFDLARGPLVRMMLLRLAEQEHSVLLTVHHIVADGWSLGILVRELTQLYAARGAGAGGHRGSPAPALPELPIQYADYAAWQREWLQGAVLERQRDYWGRQLADLAALALPTDRPRPPIQTFRGTNTGFLLPRALHGALALLCRQEDVTLFMALLAAFQALLARASGQADVAVGTPIAGRTHAETEPLIGFFVNTLVLRSDLRGNPSFAELLRRVRAVCLDAYAHQELPFEQLVEELQPTRDLSRNPLFQVMFALQNTPRDAARVSNVTLRPLPIALGTTRFDLSLTVEETGVGLAGGLEYSTDLFDSTTITRLLGHFRLLLEALVAEPARPFATLPLLSAAERQQLLFEWNDSRAAHPADLRIDQLVSAQSARTPDAVAVIFTNDESSSFVVHRSSFQVQHLTYRALNDRANQLAHELRRQGVGPTVIVGICMARSLELLIALLGVLKADAAYLPLDPNYPADRLAFMLEDAQVALLLTDSIYDLRFTIDNLEESQTLIVNRKSKIVNLAADWPTIARQPDHDPRSRISADDLAYVIYTSGSTGRPKGIPIPHRALTNFLNWARAGLAMAAHDVLPAVTTVSFDIAALELFLPLTVGARVVLLSQEVAADGARLAAQIASAHATIMQATPATWRLLLEAGWLGDAQMRILCGGEALPADLAKRLRAQVAALWNMYGPTETTIWSNVYPFPLAAADVAIGRPIANTQVYVLDAALQPAPIGIRGELYLGGTGLARGYLNRPDLTAERFVPHLWGSGIGGQGSGVSDRAPDPRSPTPDPWTRLYKTGDLARWLPDGNIMFLGRADQQVKLRGFRIELGEIEALLTQHLAVWEAAANVWEDQPGDARLVAYVVPVQGSAVSGQRLGDPLPDALIPDPRPLISELRAFLHARLPDYMLPSAFVLLDALPLTPNGKLDRAALPAPDSARPTPGSSFVAPSTPLEALLAQIWAEVLQRPAIARDDDFFALGGHSLLATQVVARIRTRLGRDLPVRALFEAPTLRAFATQLQAAEHAPPPLGPQPRPALLPLSFAQQRLWVLDQLQPGSPAYNMPIAVRLAGALDALALVASLRALIDRHAVLRTTFALVDGQPIQVIAATHPPPPLLLDLQALPATAQAPALRRLAMTEAQRPFDLARGPLLRVVMLRLLPDDHVLLLTLHHIITDGWSMRILVREVAQHYVAYTTGSRAPLAELPVQYADYAVWQRQWLRDAVLAGQLAYWTRQLAALPTLALPTDHPRPAVQTFHGAQAPLRLAPALSAALRQLSQQTGVTLFMTLLAAFQLLLARYSDQTDVAVGTPIAGRSDAATEALIGFFVNTLVLRTRLPDNPPFRGLLRGVREICLDAYAHQDVPFELLVEVLQRDRDLSRNPLFQVLFTLENAANGATELPGLAIRPLALERKTVRFDLTLSMAEEGNWLAGELEYSTDLFDATTITRLLGHFRTLLAGITADPAQHLADLPLLSAAEHQQLLVEWNSAPASARDASIVALFAAQVARTPDAVALRQHDQQLSYTALAARATRLAQQLRALGVGPDTRVALALPRSLDLVIAPLAVWQAGGTFVPLDLADPPTRLAQLLTDSQAALLLTHTALLAGLPTNTTRLILLDELASLPDRTPTNRLPELVPEQLAYVIYTSGSTGAPKGVGVAQRGLANLAQYQIAITGLTPSDRVLQFARLSFDAAVSEVLMALLSGATLCLAASEQLQPGAPLLQLLHAQAISVVTLPPAALAVLPDAPLPTLRVLLSAGEACPADLVARWAPGRRFLNGYGPTEASIGAVMAVCVPAPRPPPIGRVLPRVRAYVLHAQLQPVPLGVPGEVYLGGLGLARGYLGRPELTAERFIPNPFTDFGLRAPSGHLDFGLGTADPIQNPKSKIQNGTRLYKTGDLARWRPDGQLEYLGRSDGQVKLRGFRIELDEIAAALAQHPTVQAAVAVLREDAPDDKRIVAYVVPHQGLGIRDQGSGDPTPDELIPELRAFLAERLPAYMLPATFVLLDALPRTPNGKLDHAALPAPATLPAPDASFIGPRTPTEELLAQIWAELLRREYVGVDDNFFALGGHSLLATQLIARLRSACAVALPMRAVFEQPTLAALASQIETTRRADQGVHLPPLAPVPRDGPLPLSFAQQRLWFLDQLQPGSPAYNIPTAVGLRGPLALGALAHSLQLVVTRHEILRTTFASHAGQPIQVIRPPAAPPLPLLDLQALPPAIRTTLARQLAQQEAQQPFDLARGPLLRATLLRLADHEHLALLTMHHCVSDAWSSTILLRELTVGYSAALRAQPALLPPLPIQYADYAVWQRTWLQGAVLATQQRYWRTQLAGVATLALPIDYPRAALQSVRGATQRLRVPSAVHAGLRALSQRAGTTLFMTVLAAFQLLLSRYSGQHDIVVGTPIANRGQPETAELIGLFLNTLVLRSDLAGDPPVRELLARVREVCLGAYTHQELPFEQVVEDVQPARDLSRHPLFQVQFLLEHAPLAPPPVAEIQMQPFPVAASAIKFDLTLSFMEDLNGLTGQLEYNRDLFAAPTITRMVRHCLALLEGLVTQPEARIGALALLSRAERAQVLVQWNTTDGADQRDACVQQLFEAQANRTPDAIAVVFADVCLTYAALNQRANRLAHYLRRLGVGAEVCVGLCMERAPELLVGIMGILKAGGVYVPLDPSYPLERLAFILQDAQVSVLITTNSQDKQTRRQADTERSDLLVSVSACLDRVVDLRTDWPRIAAEPAHALQIGVSPDHLAYVIYTSGSTGQPKGVMIPHRGLTNYLRWCLATYPVAEGTGVPVHSPIGFDLTITSLLAPLLAGQQVVLLAEAAGIDALGQALGAVGDFGLVKVTPAHLAVLCQQLAPERAAGRTRAFIIGGEQLLAEQLVFWREHAPDTLLINEYGPTEAVVGCCVYVVPSQPLSMGAIAIGRPITNTQIYLLDRQMQPVPVGIVGELYIGGVQLARGYQGRPDLTAERFVPNPFAGDKEIQQSAICNLQSAIGYRLYATGDLARYQPDGVIEFIGRIDQQVKLRGYRIELGEIAATLAQHPDVRDVVVVLRTDAPGDRRLVAYVVTTKDERRKTNEIVSVETQYIASLRSPSSIVQELRLFLQQHLPDYMMPSAFVCLDALPLTANGKIDRPALPAPDLLESGPQAPFVAPRTPVEEVIAGIWADVLGVAQVSTTANFFELGGHSLLAAQIVARVYAAFGVELPLRCLFEAPTVAGLAVLIEATRQSAPALQAPPLRPAMRAGAPPLSFAQQRLWFLDQLQPNSPAYIIPSAVSLLAPLNSAKLAQSLSAIMERHEALRTTFALVDGQPVQLIALARPVPLPLLDLQPLPEETRIAVALRLAATEAHQPFDLARGPLLRATLLRLAAEHHVLLLTMHHIVSDGWSAGVFVRELTTLYAARVVGQPAHLLELPIQYADYAIWQRSWLQGDVLEAHLAYWRTQLADLPPLDLLIDRPRPPVPTFAGARMHFALSGALSAALIALSQRTEVTLFMALLAAWQVLLARSSGQDDIAVGSPVAGRTRAETENLIGCFINTLVLRTNLAGNPTFHEILRRVREMCLAAYTHQELPFEQVVEAVQPARDLSRHPLFQVLFMFQNVLVAPLTQPDRALRPLAIKRDTAQFDLTLSVEETPAGLVGSLEYRTDLFEEPTIARMLKHFRVLLEGIATDPGLPLAELPLLTDAERQQLLVDWNATAAAYPYDRCIHQLFEVQAAQTPGAVALVCEDRHLTYGELDGRAERLARYLRQLGIGTEVRVGLCLERSLELIVGLLSILKAGGAYVPLDPAYPDARLAFMLDDAQVRVVLTQRHLLNWLPDGAAQRIALDDDWDSNAAAPAPHTAALVTSENLSYVIYTSGSTGTPKGIMAHHRGLVNFTRALAEQIGLRPAQRFLEFASFSFDASALQVFPTLISGATLVLHPDPTRLSNDELLEVCRRQAITVLDLPATFWQQWVVDLATRKLRLPSTVQVCLTGGERIPRERLRTWADLAARPVRFLSSYGPTEATVTTTLFGTTSDQVAQLAQPFVALGRRLANTQLYLLDRHMQPVPIGMAGEIYLGGAGLVRGYLDRPDLTAEKFIPNPFARDMEIWRRGDTEARSTTEDVLQSAICNLQSAIGTRLYRTGDLARYQLDGNIEFLGRVDQQVKLRGFRVEMGEIAAALEEHPAVREVVLLVREDVPGDQRLVAYVVTTKDERRKTEDEEGDPSFRVPSGRRASSLVSELRSFLAERLPEYMVPSAIMLLEALPLTPNGKLDQRALPPPDRARPQLQAPYVLPRDELERQLVRIWENVLGVSPIGVTDNFFALGGHSLLAVGLMAHLQQQFKQNVSLAALFQGPTIETLACMLRDGTGDLPWSPLVGLLTGGSKPPFFCVHPAGGTVHGYIGLARHLGPDQPCYGLQARGLEQEQLPYARIEDMAAHYIEALRGVQPHGPYRVGGWSLGGIVAFEMAQQLHCQGHEVSLLAILDTGAPEPGFGDAEPDNAALLVEVIGEQNLAMSYDEFRQLAPDEQINYTLTWAKRANILPPDSGPSHVYRFLQVFKANVRAVESYEPQIYPGMITLFRTGASSADTNGSVPQAEALSDPTLGWSALSTQPIAIYDVPGEHKTMIAEPHVQVLAEQLRHCLDQTPAIADLC